MEGSRGYRISIRIVSFGVGAFILICFLFGLLFGGTQSATEFALGEAKRLERELNQPNNEFAKRIESMHLTVTFKQATVNVKGVKTIDGSQRAGTKGKNVLECSYIISAKWDGYLHKDGVTEIEVVWDNQARKVKSSSLVRSTALLNTESIDWSTVGYTVGSLIATWYLQ